MRLAHLSLTARVLLAAGAILISFFGLAGLTLDQAYQKSQEQALQEKLQGQIFALIAAVDIAPNGRIRLLGRLPESRFYAPNAGLYGQVSDFTGEAIWRSPSLRGLQVPFASGLHRSEHNYERATTSSGEAVYIYSFGVTWSDEPAPENLYTFSVAEDLHEYEARVSTFRRSLWGWLGGVGVLLLLVQSAILRWGLAPLRQAAQELRWIETGQQSRLQREYPKELHGLTANINALIDQQRARIDRYKHSLGDLAHSLKTPLAVLQNAVEPAANLEELKKSVSEQVERMTQISEYQLQRAAASGSMTLSAPVDVAPLVRKVVSSLNKVYADKQVVCHLRLDGKARFFGDEGDLMEVIGNLADNAYKWCKSEVHIDVREQIGHGDALLFIRIADDGPGIPEPWRQHILHRGVRADQVQGGHGIGLSIVAEIIRLSEGTLLLGSSPDGGAAVEVTIPHTLKH